MLIFSSQGVNVTHGGHWSLWFDGQAQDKTNREMWEISYPLAGPLGHGTVNKQ